MSSYLPRVALSDQVGLTDSERFKARDLATAWINDRLAPGLGLFATVDAFAPTDAIPPDLWIVSLFHHETVQDALGHHEDDVKTGRPFGIVAVDDSGSGWRKTWLHELGELLKDPLCDSVKMIGQRLYADEPCDAVEDDADPADPDYANLVLNVYYDPSFVGKVDWLGTLPGPIQLDKDPPVTPGGYVGFYDLAMPSAGWQQFTGARQGSARAQARQVIHPWSRRGRRRAKWAHHISHEVIKP